MPSGYRTGNRDCHQGAALVTQLISARGAGGYSMLGAIAGLAELVGPATGLLADGGGRAIDQWMASAGTLEGNQQTLILTVLVLLALAVPAVLLGLSWLANRHATTNAAKDQPFECGLTNTVGSADERFSVKFYLIAMLFLVFDLEVAFLYPWAVHFSDGGWEMIGILLVFLVILEAGYLYLYRKRALDWDD